MAYVVTDKCLICRPPYACWCNCPVDAITAGIEQAEIDQDKCISCGLCAENCNLCAIADTDAPARVAPPHEPIERECDILIVGGGSSGLIAALKASELTDKKIIVLEKAEKPGGGGMYAQGFRVFSSKWEKDAGIPDRMDDFIRSAMATTRGLLDPKLVSAAFHAVPEFFDWFCEWGNAGGFELDLSGGTGRSKGIYVRIPQHNGGYVITTSVIKRCREKNIEILTEHAAKDFITDESGRLTGVAVEDPGGQTVISFKACLIATGNLGNCTPLLEKCVPDYAHSFQRKSLHLLTSCTGDGVLMAGKAGIPIDYDSIVPAYLGPMCIPMNNHIGLQTSRCDVLKVNLNGERFTNEAVRGEPANWIALKQPKCVSYIVMDTKTLCTPPAPEPLLLHDYLHGRSVANGVPGPDGKPPSEASVLDTGPKHSIYDIYPSEDGKLDMEMIAKDMKAAVAGVSAIENSHIYCCDTLEELAEKVGVNKDTFISTVQRYNELCDKGHDDDFYKQSELMLPVREAPFYAFLLHIPSDGSFGGFSVNHKMEIIGGKDGVAQAGLYAAGDNTGSRYVNQGGEKKQIINDFTWSVASGYIAGKELAEYVNSL